MTERARCIRRWRWLHWGAKSRMLPEGAHREGNPGGWDPGFAHLLFWMWLMWKKEVGKRSSSAFSLSRTRSDNRREELGKVPTWNISVIGMDERMCWCRVGWGLRFS